MQQTAAKIWPSEQPIMESQCIIYGSLQSDFDASIPN